MIKLCSNKDLEIVEAGAQPESKTTIMEETKSNSQALTQNDAKCEYLIDLTMSSDEEFSEVSNLN